MIAPELFARWWRTMYERFPGKPDPDAASAYYSFLSERMDDRTFEQAARALWASEEYFPRPARFLEIRALLAWPAVLEHCRRLHVRGTDDEQLAQIRAHLEANPVPKIARVAIEQLGGRYAMRERIEKDPSRAKRMYLETVLDAIAIDAGLDQDAPLELALSAGPPPVIALTPGSAPG